MQKLRRLFFEVKYLKKEGTAWNIYGFNASGHRFIFSLNTWNTGLLIINKCIWTLEILHFYEEMTLKKTRELARVLQKYNFMVQCANTQVGWFAYDEIWQEYLLRL